MDQSQVIRPGRISRRPVSWLPALLLGAILTAFPCKAADSPAETPAETTLEYQVKAAFLLNFTKFIEWPPGALGNPDTPLSICILGDDPFGAGLDAIAGGEVVNGRKITIQRVKRPPVPVSCRVLFVAAHEKELRSPLDIGPGVLTVGEGEGFIHNGGMIAFVIENRRVRFIIDQEVAQKAGFQLSSKLLSIAKAVER